MIWGATILRTPPICPSGRIAPARRLGNKKNVRLVDS